MDIRNVQAIDIHSHFNSGSPEDVEVSELYRCDVPFLKTEYDACNIACGGFSSFSSVCSTNHVFEENENAFRLAESTPWFFQWVVLNPFDERTYEQAKRMLSSKKVLGLKIHPSYHKYSLAEYGDNIFKFAAENDSTILMHPDYLELVPDFANRYSSCKVIAAHLGSYRHIDCIEKATHGNIYADTSGSASLTNNIVEYTVSKIGAERILFGTDTYSCAAQRGRIELARLPESNKIAILRENAKRLFWQFNDL